MTFQIHEGFIEDYLDELTEGIPSIILKVKDELPSFQETKILKLPYLYTFKMLKRNRPGLINKINNYQLKIQNLSSEWTGLKFDRNFNVAGTSEAVFIRKAAEIKQKLEEIQNVDQTELFKDIDSYILSNNTFLNYNNDTPLPKKVTTNTTGWTCTDYVGAGLATTAAGLVACATMYSQSGGFNKIVNPKTGKKVSVHGKLGKKILKNYIKQLKKL